MVAAETRIRDHAHARYVGHARIDFAGVACVDQGDIRLYFFNSQEEVLTNDLDLSESNDPVELGSRPFDRENDVAPSDEEYD